MTTRPKARAIADEVQRRIADRIWRPGEMIPHEAELAVEFGAARATVNKALQILADQGLIERRRRAGTRVTENPALRAVFSIPVVRREIEAAGRRYRHQILGQREEVPPDDILDRMRIGGRPGMIHLHCLHMADDRPFLAEDRWINPEGAPAIRTANFDAISVNEWLVQHAPYTGGTLAYGAENATGPDARMLDVDPGSAILVLTRTTWNDRVPITHTRAAHRPGYLLCTGF